MAKTATVYIHGGDYDCSELVRMCYRAVDILPYGSYMWTGNEIELLTENGFIFGNLDFPKVGDVLLRDGHTEIYLGMNKQGGARHGDYPGGLSGRQGDQDGTEITKSVYRKSDWTYLLRYAGGKKVNGIPAAVAAALVAEHIIDHNAHGYSQPNRMGDGTIEEIKITWDGSSDTGSSESTDYNIAKVDFTVKFTCEKHPIRTAPSKTAGKIVANYTKGETAHIEGLVLLGDKHAWGMYIGATSKQRRYVALEQAIII